MQRPTSYCLCLAALGLALAACAPAAPPQIAYDPAALRFEGAQALAHETEFVTRFPNRASGRPNNRLAAEWLLAELARLGWACRLDEWTIVNYSRPVPLNNVACTLPGRSEREILVIAHHDQAPTTVQGADNDGSGVAILLTLAEIFAAEAPPPYTLAFVATDAEEYGMIGSGRYVTTHPDSGRIIAAVSLDNLGRTYYSGMNMELIGQFRRYGPVWLALTARAAAQAAGGDWPVNLPGAFDQITNQAAPISFMDQGPLVAAGVPALGLAGAVPPAFADEHYRLWHDPDDTLEYQSAYALGQSGRIAEALIRQLSAMQTFPQEAGPYLYFDAQGGGQVLRGLPLWLIFIGFVGLFFLGSGRAARGAGGLRGWRAALPHFLSLWLSLTAAVVSLYVMVAVGLMDKYHVYPATTKDPAILHPRWPAVGLFLLGLAVFLFVGRRAARRLVMGAPPAFGAVKSLALCVVGLAGVYVLALNPFSLLFFIPVLFWLLIDGKRGWGGQANLLFFLLGGLVIYVLIYQFGFVVLRYNFVFLWFLLNMFSIGMLSFPTAAAIMAVFAAGLTLVVAPPRRT